MSNTRLSQIKCNLVTTLKAIKAGLYGKMHMQSRNQYLKVLRERYLKGRTKKEKSQILDEYCRYLVTSANLSGVRVPSCGSQPRSS